MILSLKYGDLSSAISEANKLANELGQYCDCLSKKVQQKMYSVEGGMSSALNNADYYVRAKITQLRIRENNARTLSSNNQILLDTAKRVDTDVEKTIQANQKIFFQQNAELKTPWYQQAWTSFICDMKNVPVIGWLIKYGEQELGALEQLYNDIRYWWRCGGGEELIMNCLDIVIKVTLAVAAVVTAVTAVVALVTATVLSGGAILFAVAACILAVIVVVNAVTNTVTSVKAIAANNSDNPAMSKIYSERDTLAQVLHERNFHDRKKNRASNAWATAIEITETVAGVVVIVHSIGKIAGTFLSKNGVGFAFKELAHGADGKLTTKVTLGSIWKGTKAMFLNQKLTTSTAAGLRTTLFANIKQSFSLQATLFKLAMRDPGSWMKAKQIGNSVFFINIAENMRYEAWQLKNTAFQFKTGNALYNLQKTAVIVDTANDIFKNTKLVLNGLDREDNKGLIRRLSEKFAQDTLFDNDFTKLIDKTGFGWMATKFDKPGIIRDFTGIDKGLIQKVNDIKKSFESPFPTFESSFPYFECIRGDVYAQ